MSNFSKVNVGQDARTELHDKLSLTGAEISVNNLPAGAGVPFVHSHKQNEEIYEKRRREFNENFRTGGFSGNFYGRNFNRDSERGESGDNGGGGEQS